VGSRVESGGQDGKSHTFAPETIADSRAGAKPGTVVVENVVRPGTSRSVDAGKYGAMRHAVLRVLPRQALGMTLADALPAMLPLLPQAIFPQARPPDGGSRQSSSTSRKNDKSSEGERARFASTESEAARPGG
jgi:hypothetical protein